jgi:arylsulfatase I/J
MFPIMMRILGFMCATTALATEKQLPHIFFVVVDDFGWAEVGYHQSETTAGEARTPGIDALVREGVELNRHYVHMTCTPTRASFQSGRLPAHVLTNLATACDENGAIPRNMTGIASVLKRAGYATHQVGKWDAGMVTPSHTPKGRGYDSSLNYFSHGNWMYSEAAWRGSYDHRPDLPTPDVIDLWDTDRPARHLNGTGYEEYIFRDRMLKILREHDQSKPLFLQYDSKVAHYPLQVPPEYEAKFAHISYVNRRIYNAMINFLDDQLLNITNTMKELGMWENTLMVLSSDNGGFVRDPKGGCNHTDSTFPGSDDSTDWGHGTACQNGEAGANNFPLRGGKYSNFEGGIRVNAFMSGGFLPKQVRGTKQEEMMHIADWYRTLAEGVVGVDATDHLAAASKLPPVDSLNLWPLLSGEDTKNPRAKLGILVHENMLVRGQWKYVSGNMSMIEAASGGPRYPNATTASDPIDAHSFACPLQGCLFNVVLDPTEQREVSSEHPDVTTSMSQELRRQAAGMWQTSHKEDPACEVAAFSLYGGFYGPWKEVEQALHIV